MFNIDEYWLLRIKGSKSRISLNCNMQHLNFYVVLLKSFSFAKPRVKLKTWKCKLSASNWKARLEDYASQTSQKSGIIFHRVMKLEYDILQAS